MTHAEPLLISCILNDPQPLPDIFKFLSAQDFEDQDCAWIYAAFDATYSGLTMDTNVWLKKAFEFLTTQPDVNALEARLALRGYADAAVDGSHPVTLARVIRKESLHRRMVSAAEEWARWDVRRSA